MPGKRSLGSMVEQVSEGGNERRVGREWGIPFDPEGVRGKAVVVGIKVGGVMWEVGIGGVRAALEEEGFVVCEGTRWLVDDEEWERRVKLSKMSSTVVAFVRGLEEARRLMKRGLWLSGQWHLVRHFEVVQPMRKKSGWMWVRNELEEIRKAGELALRKLKWKVEEDLKVMRRAVEEIRDGIKRYRMDRDWVEEEERKKVKEVVGRMMEESLEVSEEEERKVKKELWKKVDFGASAFSFSGLSGGVKEFVSGQAVRPIGSFTSCGEKQKEVRKDLASVENGKRWKCRACGAPL